MLDTIDIGVQAISQSEDQLLPMIHRLWPPMVKRFTDDEQVNGMEVFFLIILFVSIDCLQLLVCNFENSASSKRQKMSYHNMTIFFFPLSLEYRLNGLISVSEQLRTYPSLNPTLTQFFYRWIIIGLGEG